MPSFTSPNFDIARPTGQAMLRGTLGRCPACGKGRLFGSFLKVCDHCPACDEALHHQRADDGPAYITLLVVSHLMGPLLLTSYLLWRPSPLAMILGLGTGAVVLSLWLLPRIKGAIVGLQWAQRMHGFDGKDPAPGA